MRSVDAIDRSCDDVPPGLPLPLSGVTSLFAIIGDPIAQVGSPMLFNSAFRQRGWPAVLVPLHVNDGDLAETLQGLRNIRNLRGIVLTTPHKSAALDLVDEIGPEAKLVRAINAIRCQNDGRWIGENFDGLGCVQGLRSAGLEVSGRRVLIVGTGGAGRAVAASIARERPSRLILYDLNRKLATRTSTELNAAYAELSVEVGDPVPEGVDLVINCTPVGMVDFPGLPVDVARLTPGTVVVDLVVEPEMTPLLEAALAIGCQIQSGRQTLAGQVDAVCAFFEGVEHG